MARNARLAVTSALMASAVVAGCMGTTFPEVRPIGGEDAAGVDALGAFAQGKTYLKEGQYGLAVQALRQAVRQEPASVERLNALAVAYDKLGRADLAKRYFSEALALAPGSVQTLNNLGYFYAQQGDYRVAQSFLERAAQGEAARPTVLANLAMVEERAEAAREMAAAAPAKTVALAQATVEPELWIERTGLTTQRLLFKEESYALLAPAEEPLAMSVIEVSYIEPVPAPPIDLQYLEPIAAPEAAAVAVPYPHATLSGWSASSSHLNAQAVAIRSPAPKSTPHPQAAALAGEADLHELVIEVSNGVGRTKMAARMRDYLEVTGVPVDRLTNADHYAYTASVVLYHPGHERAAEALAAALPVRVELKLDLSGWSDLRLLLGGDMLDFDRELIARADGLSA